MTGFEVSTGGHDEKTAQSSNTLQLYPESTSTIASKMHKSAVYEHTNNRFSRPFPTAIDENGANTIVREDFLHRKGFILRNFLTLVECRYFIGEAEGIGMRRLPYRSSSPRKGSRIAIQSEDVAECLFQRAKPFLPSDVRQVLNRQIEPGTWEPFSLNDVFRVVQYGTGDMFLPHHDGSFAWSRSEKSILTLMVYLNDDFEGGETRFFRETQRHYAEADPIKLIHSYQPNMGDAMVFFGQQTHDGAELTSGCKYILRSEVMYRIRKDEIPTYEPDYVDDGQFGESAEDILFETYSEEEDFSDSDN